MKKLMYGLVALVLLTGCAKTTISEYQLEEEEEGVRFTMHETVTSKDDYVTRLVIVDKIEFLTEESAQNMDVYTEFLQQQVDCPRGIWDEEAGKMVGCSKYVVSEIKVEENAVTFTETIDYEGSFKNKESIISELVGGVFEENSYYSLEVFDKEYIEGGYTKIK